MQSVRVHFVWRFWLEFALARLGRALALHLAKFYAQVATVRRSLMVEGVRSGVIARVGMAIYVDGQLKVGGHF